MTDATDKKLNTQNGLSLNISDLADSDNTRYQEVLDNHTTASDIIADENVKFLVDHFDATVFLPIDENNLGSLQDDEAYERYLVSNSANGTRRRVKKTRILILDELKDHSVKKLLWGFIKTHYPTIAQQLIDKTFPRHQLYGQILTDNDIDFDLLEQELTGKIERYIDRKSATMIHSVKS